MLQKYVNKFNDLFRLCQNWRKPWQTDPPVPSILEKYRQGARKRLLVALLALAGGLSPALAQDPIIGPGDAVVSGFSGLRNVPKPVPLDGFYIDPDGASLQILPLGVSSDPAGQFLNSAAKFSAKAREIGQVFAITLARPADADPLTEPDIYVAQSSTFGLHLVVPDTDGDGEPERTKTGAPNASWMEGQFGNDIGGGPGSIYRINGQTGEVSLFTTIPDNSGVGIGDIVFDANTRQFFVSDFENGTIYRLDENGVIIDQFDHGTSGRANAGLAEIADDGQVLDITNPGFDTENTDSWGLTQPERRIWALGLNGGRLYYSVWDGPQIWSVGINDDGSFAGDARREIEVNDVTQPYPISDMVFDGRGRLFLAQRGGLQSRYDYTVFAKAKESHTLRYTRKPDGTWWTPPKEYAVGFPPQHRNASGGLDLGIRLSSNQQRVSGCDVTLWNTGDSLRDSAELDEPRIVHGLQGMNTSLTRPDNVPPNQSGFLDYDGKFDDPTAEGHVGDVEIWQPCEGRPTYGTFVPVYEPGEIPPGWEIPEGDPEFNLELKKVADPKECWEAGAGWLCWYTITIKNTGLSDFFGPIKVEDWLPASPAGSFMDFHFQPFPWLCNPPTPNFGFNFECTHAPVFLAPGDSIDLFVDAWVPNAFPSKANGCQLTNAARLVWPAGTSDADPTDDLGWDVADIPSENCEDVPPEPTNLKIEKKQALGLCVGDHDWCTVWQIDLFNTGPGTFNDIIKIQDVFPAGANFSTSDPAWNCLGDTCETIGPVVLLPSPPSLDKISLVVQVSGDGALAHELGCELTNKAVILDPLGDPKNTDPLDDESEDTQNLPDEYCPPPPEGIIDEPAKEDPPLKSNDKSNLRIEKKAQSPFCSNVGGNWWCAWLIKIFNEGPSDVKTELKLDELLPAEPEDANWSADWECMGDGDGGPEAMCKREEKLIAAGSSVNLTLKTAYTTAQVKEMNCKLTNKVSIAFPAGGTSKNTKASDDSAQAVARVPSHICDKLTIDPPVFCPPGYQRVGDTCIRGGDSCPRGWTKTPIPGRCCPPNKPWSGNSCGIDVIVDPAHPQCGRGWTKLDINRYKYYQDLKWRLKFLTLGNRRILCGIAPPPPSREPKCDSGWTKLNINRYNYYKSQKWQLRIKRLGNKRILCGIAPPPPSRDPKCDSGWTKLNINRYNYYKSQKWQLRIKRLGNKRILCGIAPKPPVRGPQCDRGWTKLNINAYQSLKQKGWTLRFKSLNNQRILCGKPPISSGSELRCDKGWRKYPLSMGPSLRKQGYRTRIKTKGRQRILCAIKPAGSSITGNQNNGNTNRPKRKQPTVNNPRRVAPKNLQLNRSKQLQFQLR